MGSHAEITIYRQRHITKDRIFIECIDDIQNYRLFAFLVGDRNERSGLTLVDPLVHGRTFGNTTLAKFTVDNYINRILSPVMYRLIYIVNRDNLDKLGEPFLQYQGTCLDALQGEHTASAIPDSTLPTVAELPDYKYLEMEQWIDIRDEIQQFTDKVVGYADDYGPENIIVSIKIVN